MKQKFMRIYNFNNLNTGVSLSNTKIGSLEKNRSDESLFENIYLRFLIDSSWYLNKSRRFKIISWYFHLSKKRFKDCERQSIIKNMITFRFKIRYNISSAFVFLCLDSANLEHENPRVLWGLGDLVLYYRSNT